MARFEFVQWLATWLFSVSEFEFEWDEGNSAKSFVRHGIAAESAEQVFRNKDLLVPLGIQVAPVANEPRFGVLGTAATGELVAVSFTIRNGRIRVISARSMSRKERRHYAEVR
jgi:uncharacterized protein